MDVLMKFKSTLSYQILLVNKFSTFTCLLTTVHYPPPLPHVNHREKKPRGPFEDSVLSAFDAPILEPFSPTAVSETDRLNSKEKDR